VFYFCNIGFKWGLNFRSACGAAVYRKVLRLSPTGKNKHELKQTT